jgi:hypothetical protein
MGPDGGLVVGSVMILTGNINQSIAELHELFVDRGQLLGGDARFRT